ncbi:hypothetical protein JKP88DRAFT_300048, partial [Tribonema minus]
GGRRASLSRHPVPEGRRDQGGRPGGAGPSRRRRGRRPRPPPRRELGRLAHLRRGRGGRAGRRGGPVAAADAQAAGRRVLRRRAVLRPVRGPGDRRGERRRPRRGVSLRFFGAGGLDRGRRQARRRVRRPELAHGGPPEDGVVLRGGVLGLGEEAREGREPRSGGRAQDRQGGGRDGGDCGGDRRGRVRVRDDGDGDGARASPRPGSRFGGERRRGAAPVVDPGGAAAVPRRRGARLSGPGPLPARPGHVPHPRLVASVVAAVRVPAGVRVDVRLPARGRPAFRERLRRGARLQAPASTSHEPRQPLLRTRRRRARLHRASRPPFPPASSRPARPVPRPSLGGQARRRQGPRAPSDRRQGGRTAGGAGGLPGGGADDAEGAGGLLRGSRPARRRGGSAGGRYDSPCDGAPPQHGGDVLGVPARVRGAGRVARAARRRRRRRLRRPRDTPGLLRGLVLGPCGSTVEYAS